MDPIVAQAHPGFLYRIQHCGVLVSWGKAAANACSTFERNYNQ